MQWFSNFYLTTPLHSQKLLRAYNSDSDTNSDCVGFIPTLSNSLTQAGRPTIQLNSDTIYLETVSDSTG